MMLPFHKEGVYRFRIVYNHSAFTHDELQELRGAQIEPPTVDALSEPIVVDFHAGKINLLLGTP